MHTQRTVLLVDDDEQVRESLQQLIERAGMKCLTAENALQALAALRVQEVQVVLADHDMPGMDGVEMLKLVATRHPEVCRILLTGRRDGDTAVRALNVAHAYRYLTKPCRGTDLLTTLHFACETSDAERATRSLRAELRRQTALLAEARRRFPELIDTLEAARAPQAG